MEAIRDIYDLMKMQKPRTNNNCVSKRPLLISLPPKGSTQSGGKLVPVLLC